MNCLKPFALFIALSSHFVSPTFAQSLRGEYQNLQNQKNQKEKVCIHASENGQFSRDGNPVYVSPEGRVYLTMTYAFCNHEGFLDRVRREESSCVDVNARNDFPTRLGIEVKEQEFYIDSNGDLVHLIKHSLLKCSDRTLQRDPNIFQRRYRPRAGFSLNMPGASIDTGCKGNESQCNTTSFSRNKQVPGDSTSDDQYTPSRAKPLGGSASNSCVKPALTDPNRGAKYKDYFDCIKNAMLQNL